MLNLTFWNRFLNNFCFSRSKTVREIRIKDKIFFISFTPRQLTIRVTSKRKFFFGLSFSRQQDRPSASYLQTLVKISLTLIKRQGRAVWRFLFYKKKRENNDIKKKARTIKSICMSGGPKCNEFANKNLAAFECCEKSGTNHRRRSTFLLEDGSPIRNRTMYSAKS